MKKYDLIVAAGSQTLNEKGEWVPAVPMRKATWLEVMLDRWIGPRTADLSPWRSVLKGIFNWTFGGKG